MHRDRRWQKNVEGDVEAGAAIVCTTRGAASSGIVDLILIAACFLRILGIVCSLTAVSWLLPLFSLLLMSNAGILDRCLHALIAALWQFKSLIIFCFSSKFHSSRCLISIVYFTSDTAGMGGSLPASIPRVSRSIPVVLGQGTRLHAVFSFR